MFRSVALLCLLFCYVQCHVFVLGSRGGVTTASVNPPYASINNQAPCGGIANTEAQYFNVTKGDVFTFSWSLFVNHNLPPTAPGSIVVGFAAGDNVSPTTNFAPVGPAVPISTQPINYFYPYSFVIPAITGPATIQLLYSASVSQAYYQCIDFYIN